MCSGHTEMCNEKVSQYLVQGVGALQHEICEPIQKLYGSVYGAIQVPCRSAVQLESGASKNSSQIKIRATVPKIPRKIPH